MTLTFYSIYMAVMVLFLIHLFIIARIRSKAFNIARKNADLAIKINAPNWLDYWEEYTNGISFDGMVFSLHKWTFNQFYPNLKLKEDSYQSMVRRYLKKDEFMSETMTRIWGDILFSKPEKRKDAIH